MIRRGIKQFKEGMTYFAEVSKNSRKGVKQLREVSNNSRRY